jgi:hypothetical protein
MTSMMERNLLRTEEYSNPARSSRKQMVWAKTPQLEAWTCLACAWVFRPSGPPVGNSLDEMMLNFELQRDTEFASHLCSAHPRAKTARDNFKFPGRVNVPVRGSNPVGGVGRNKIMGDL